MLLWSVKCVDKKLKMLRKKKCKNVCWWLFDTRNYNICANNSWRTLRCCYHSYLCNRRCLHHSLNQRHACTPCSLLSSLSVTQKIDTAPEANVKMQPFTFLLLYMALLIILWHFFDKKPNKWACLRDFKYQFLSCTSVNCVVCLKDMFRVVQVCLKTIVRCPNEHWNRVFLL